MDRENWDDLRFVLAVADRGSVSAAARALGVNHATVLRRIAAFEARAGAPLFEHSPRGYLVPPERRRIIEAAREVDRATQGVWRLMQGAKAPLSGEVRVTSTDSLCQRVLPMIAAGLRDAAPKLELVLLCSNLHLDLARTHADIAVRPTLALPEDLTGQIAGTMEFAVYAAAETTAAETAAADLAPRSGDMRWLGMHGALARSAPGRWLAEAVEGGSGGADSFVVLAELAALGQGRTVLPRFIGDADWRLREIPHAMPLMVVPIWVATHPDLAEVPRVARVRDLLIEALAARFAR